jgi:dTDP-4-amino-4,6-dideoxy-D-galactose acyltransferase
MKIETLSWDSDFFQIKVGRIFLEDDIDFIPNTIIEQIKLGKFQLIYIFKYNTPLSQKNVLSTNLELVDIQLTLSKVFKAEDYINIPYLLTNQLSVRELQECYNIADEIALKSRFNNEILIGKEKTKKLYRKWIDNALNKSFGDGLLLEKSGNLIVGIFVIKSNYKSFSGTCSLIGVENNFKGKGIGMKLWMQAFGFWAKKGDINKCLVAISLKNIESLNFHLKNGFNKIENINYIYHYRNIL